MNRIIPAAIALMGSAAALASGPVPKEDLMTPPDDAQRYIIVSDTNTHGDEWRWETEEGATAFRKSQSLRGWITETDALIVQGYDGKPLQITIRGVTPRGDAAEKMTTDEEGIRWEVGTETGMAPQEGGMYLPKGGPQSIFGLLVEYMLDKGEVKLLPSGTARLRDGGTLLVQLSGSRVQLTPIDSGPSRLVVIGPLPHAKQVEAFAARLRQLFLPA